MILMRENVKKSMFQSLSKSGVDLSASRTTKQQRHSGFECSDCGRTYKLKSSLRNHKKWECGKEPQFKCPCCVYRAKQKMHMERHIERMHKGVDCTLTKKILNVRSKRTETE